MHGCKIFTWLSQLQAFRAVSSSHLKISNFLKIQVQLCETYLLLYNRQPVKFIPTLGKKQHSARNPAHSQIKKSIQYKGSEKIKKVAEAN
jgi:hypothetical protein